MPNTFTQIHIQAVFAVKFRESMIEPEWKDLLCKLISGIIRDNGHKPLAINGVHDHIHILFGFRPHQSLSGLMQNIKGGSSRWINNNKITKRKFYWQEGYAAFAYSKNQLPHIIKYIEQQEIHHRKRSFLTEYKKLLDVHDVVYDEKYLFKPLSD